MYQLIAISISSRHWGFCKCHTGQPFSKHLFVKRPKWCYFNVCYYSVDCKAWSPQPANEGGMQRSRLFCTAPSLVTLILPSLQLNYPPLHPSPSSCLASYSHTCTQHMLHTHRPGAGRFDWQVLWCTGLHLNITQFESHKAKVINNLLKLTLHKGDEQNAQKNVHKKTNICFEFNIKKHEKKGEQEGELPVWPNILMRAEKSALEKLHLTHEKQRK